MQNKMVQEVLTAKGIVNLEDVWFENVDSGLYIMNGTMKNGFTIDVGVTEELKQEIEKLIVEGINNNENKR